MNSQAINQLRNSIKLLITYIFLRTYYNNFKFSLILSALTIFLNYDQYD